MNYYQKTRKELQPYTAYNADKVKYDKWTPFGGLFTSKTSNMKSFSIIPQPGPIIEIWIPHYNLIDRSFFWKTTSKRHTICAHPIILGIVLDSLQFILWQGTQNIYHPTNKISTTGKIRILRPHKNTSIYQTPET